MVETQCPDCGGAGYLYDSDGPRKCELCWGHGKVCSICGGAGEVYTHSPDCHDDLCALAGGYHDCEGIVEPCECVADDDPPCPSCKGEGVIDSGGMEPWGTATAPFPCPDCNATGNASNPIQEPRP